jgi:uncharacterized RDD family membrane protein YckC
VEAAGTTSCRITTPEGIALSFPVAAAGDRLVAFLLDMLVVAIMVAAIALCTLPMLLLEAAGASAIALAILLVAAFVVRNFYFIICELVSSGTTWGKRKLRLRVIARDGGPLTADMIVARNLTRDLEVFLPLTVLVAPQVLFPERAGWGAVVAIVWLLVLAFLPLFSRYRLRCGDLIAGTVVVTDPTAVLLPDLADHRPVAAGAQPPSPAPEYSFTPKQLELYGIHELHTLEAIFRKHEQGQAPPELLSEVCERIKKKIGWPRERWDVAPEAFLRAFYKTQRAHLERKLLFGTRKERKSDASPGS